MSTAPESATEPKQNIPILLSSNSLWNIVHFRSAIVRRLASSFTVVVAAPAHREELARFDLPAEVEPIAVDRSGLIPWRDARLLLAYRALMRRLRPAAYVSWTIKPNIYGALAARAIGVPAILNVSGLGTAFLSGGLFSRFISLLYRFAFRSAHVVFFQNGDDRDLFVSRRLVRAGQARLLPGSGIDLDRFAIAPLTVEPGAPVFLLVARLLGDKGVREFVAAARSLRSSWPHARFQLLGPLDRENRSAIGRAELDRWVAEGAVEYLGTAEDVRPMIAAATMLVLPSYREGLPRTLLEGGAIGRALIATDVPGCRDVVVDGLNGLLCRVRDWRSLADAMERMAQLAPERLRAMGEASRRKVQQEFSEELVTDAYVRAIAELPLGRWA